MSNKTIILGAYLMLSLVVNTFLLVQMDKYRNIASVESDIIRCYYDIGNKNIYPFAQSFLNVIDENTISISNYGYCY